MPSSLERFLKGKQLSGAVSSSPVSAINKHGKNRIVHFKDGSVQSITKRKLLGMFDSTLQREQAKVALRSVKQKSDGSATARLGGKIRGEVKTYVSKQAAIRAIKRAYKKGF